MLSRRWSGWRGPICFGCGWAASVTVFEFAMSLIYPGKSLFLHEFIIAVIGAAIGLSTLLIPPVSRLIGQSRNARVKIVSLIPVCWSVACFGILVFFRSVFNDNDYFRLPSYVRIFYARPDSYPESGYLGVPWYLHPDSYYFGWVVFLLFAAIATSVPYLLALRINRQSADSETA